ncbi:MAG: flippase-like domain-containing protein [Solirubrobacterales bacterium]|nr:flippase-like domain-containing protein [Solirubrobacterales bacterium]
MHKLHAHPVRVTLGAFALATAAVVAIAGAYGFGAFARAWSHLDFVWLAVVVGGQLLAVPAYMLCYRALARVNDGPRLQPALVARVVTGGFGPFAVRGGFVLDKRALHAIEGDEEAAKVRVLGLGALEWALLAPAACASALALLVMGDPRPMASLLWPWAIAVPVGFAVGFWLAAPAQRRRIADGDGRFRHGLDIALRAVATVSLMARGFASYWAAWIGMAAYWALDLASFYGALRFIGLHLNLGEAILAYATGYALTRRSMPLGGAGVTEVLMTLALHWVGQPVAPALAAVVVYRVFNFVLPTIPALLVRDRVKLLLEAADEGRTPAHEERGRAAEPLGQLLSG